MSDVGQGKRPTPLERIETWISIAERNATRDRPMQMYSGDWASLASALQEARAEIISQNQHYQRFDE